MLIRSCSNIMLEIEGKMQSTDLSCMLLQSMADPGAYTPPILVGLSNHGFTGVQSFKEHTAND